MGIQNFFSGGGRGCPGASEGWRGRPRFVDVMMVSALLCDGRRTRGWAAMPHDVEPAGVVQCVPRMLRQSSHWFLAQIPLLQPDTGLLHVLQQMWWLSWNNISAILGRQVILVRLRCGCISCPADGARFLEALPMRPHDGFSSFPTGHPQERHDATDAPQPAYAHDERPNRSGLKLGRSRPERETGHPTVLTLRQSGSKSLPCRIVGISSPCSQVSQ